MLEIDHESGLFVSVKQCLSPNCDERPDPEDIAGIVIHNISLPPSEFGGQWVNDLFLNKLDPNAHPYFEEIHHLKVSSHLFINRQGECTQFVPFHLRAWHAGVSNWQGRERCNDFTIGIELEGDDFSPFTLEQYETLIVILKSLIATYPKLNSATITGHEHIAPGRKTDPGPYFDWQYIQTHL